MAQKVPCPAQEAMPPLMAMSNTSELIPPMLQILRSSAAPYSITVAYRRIDRPSSSFRKRISSSLITPPVLIPSLNPTPALPPSSGTPLLLLPELLRNALASLAMALGFAALARRPGSERSLLQELQSPWRPSRFGAAGRR
jgi:hypothetical protein